MNRSVELNSFSVLDDWLKLTLHVNFLQWILKFHKIFLNTFNFGCGSARFPEGNVQEDASLSLDAILIASSSIDSPLS